MANDFDLRQVMRAQEQQKVMLLNTAAALFHDVLTRRYCDELAPDDRVTSEIAFAHARLDAREFIVMRFGEQLGGQLLKAIDPEESRGAGA